MNVHIVCRDHDKGQGILPRLTRILMKQNGWGAAGTPNGLTDINYFSVYVEYGERYSDWHQTKTAAYFSHFEEGVTYKEFWWEMAANQVDLRICTAPMYAEMLGEFGPTILVRPPVDRSRFTIQPKQEHPKPIVGLSGFVRPNVSDRKGARLVANLANDKLGKKIALIASGSGWPVQTREHTIAELPMFYQGLDVLLCSSLIEGIPMPPLEALACGIKVVIPRGVGLLDTLPEMAGIYRFEKGNYKDMRNAVEQACFGGDEIDREALRGAVAEYTPENWAEDHRRAFENLMFNIEKAPIESDRHGKRGLYCVAYGEPSRRCAFHMMKSFREFMPPDIEIAVASDREIGPEDYLIKVEDVDIGGRHAKTMIYDVTPKDWQYVMYLDADTQVIKKGGEFLYKILEDGWDMSICTNPDKFHWARRMVRSDNKDECDFTFNKLGTDELIQLNGGVFSFQRNARTAAFFRAWHSEWNRWGKRDQAALLRALFDNPVRLYVLTNVWNCITRYVSNPEQYSAFLVHFPMTARRWRGTVQGRSDSKEAWGKVAQFKDKK